MRRSITSGLMVHLSSWEYLGLDGESFTHRIAYTARCAVARHLSQALSRLSSPLCSLYLCNAEILCIYPQCTWADSAIKCPSVVKKKPRKNRLEGPFPPCSSCWSTITSKSERRNSVQLVARSLRADWKLNIFIIFIAGGKKQQLVCSFLVCKQHFQQ